MWVGCQLLVKGNILRFPAEESAYAHIQETNVDRWVQQRLPHGCRRQYSSSTEGEEQNVWRGFDKGVHDTTGKPSGCHGGRQSHENVNLFVENRVDRKSRKRLSSALRESDV